MGKKNFMVSHASWLSCLLVIPFFCFCAGKNQTPSATVSFHRFSVGDEVYRIRSISSADKGVSRNEVIAKNFVAADFNQDRIIDRILLGEVSLSEAQRIYDIGLKALTVGNKLKQREPTNHRYTHQTSDFLYEIRSFQPVDAEPFNEFKIIDLRPLLSQATILIDYEADGTLDEVLKGSIAMDEAQARYVEAIHAGLEKNALVQVERSILVSER